MGDRTLQGPHQDAQKSTSTGIGDLSTSASKFSFVITISDIYVERVFLIEAYRYSNFRLVVCQSSRGVSVLLVTSFARGMACQN